MEIFGFTEEFVLFLGQWSFHTTSIMFAGAVWLGTVVHLFVTKHALLGKKGDSNDIACGDKRVHRRFVVFGGPSGLTFGLPYFYVMTHPMFGLIMDQIPFDLGSLLHESWRGFTYLQFITSVIQTMWFLLQAWFGERPSNFWRLFKSHLKGCGWVSGLSPLGWPLYVFQQFTPNSFKWIWWLLRDVETLALFVINLPQVMVICLLASLRGVVTIPMITWIDQNHDEDEDSSSKVASWSGPIR